MEEKKARSKFSQLTRNRKQASERGGKRRREKKRERPRDRNTERHRARDGARDRESKQRERWQGAQGLLVAAGDASAPRSPFSCGRALGPREEASGFCGHRLATTAPGCLGLHQDAPSRPHTNPQRPHTQTRPMWKLRELQRRTRQPQTQNGERGTEGDKKEGGAGRELRMRTVQGPPGGGCQQERPGGGSESTRGKSEEAKAAPEIRPFRVSRLHFQQRHIREPFSVFNLDSPPTPTPAAGDPRHRVSAAWAKGLGSRTGRRVQPGTLVPVSTSQGCRLQDTRSSLGPPVLSLSCRAVECGVRSPAGSPSCLSLTLQD